MFSVPCEEKLPLNATGNHFHYKHYYVEEVMKLIKLNGLHLKSWAGQDCYYFDEHGMQGGLLHEDEMRLKEETVGQFIVFFCERPE